jgi:hypothetical protein
MFKSLFLKGSVAAVKFLEYRLEYQSGYMVGSVVKEGIEPCDLFALTWSGFGYL